ncbi:MAG: tyrosine-type recombinase/integrase [Devosia sp.]
MKTNAKNERLKRRYFEYLREHGQLDAQSVDAEAKALSRYEVHSGWRDFGRYRTELAISFKHDLAEQTNSRTGGKLSKATVYATLTALRKFFTWLADQPGYRGRITKTAADYFRTSLKDRTAAKAIGPERVPTLDQVHTVIASMPAETAVELRDRALIAITIVTGARDDAIASLRLKHVNLVEGSVFQDGRVVRTKFAKGIDTTFFPVHGQAEAIVREWIAYLVEVHGFGPEDPLFPPTKMAIGEDGNFTRSGFSRTCWANADPIRSVFKRAFLSVGLPYFNPHSFRKTLTRLGMELPLSDAARKAWSQNLGHDDVMVTLRSYGELPRHQQHQLIKAAAHAREDDAVALQLGHEVLASIRAKKVG